MTLDTKTLIRYIRIRQRIWASSEHTALLPSQSIDGSKSSARSNEFRKRGNEFYKKKNFENAKHAYTLCIAYALEDSEELYKAYGNRSAVLFELRKYVSCLLDINRALKSQYCPNLLRQKLLDRKERCLALMKSSIDGSGDTEDEIDEGATEPPTDQEPSWRADMFSQFGNPLLPNASPKIEIAYNERWGRHYVATADINTGETLMTENYFLTVFSSLQNCYTRCNFCIEMCDALIPCPSCARVMYCSDRCRKQAYDSHHRMECKLFSLGFCGSLFESFAIRLFLTGTEQGKILVNLMDTLSIADIFEENFDFSGKPLGSDYLTALRMTMQNGFNESRLVSYIKSAIGVVIGLRKSNFFESVPADRLKDAELFAIALLLNNYSSSRYKNTVGDRGHGRLVLGYFLNHSCFPNVSRCLLKRESILTAVRPIKKGEQIFIAYSDDFIKTPKEKRIQQFDFTCQCEACFNDWPSFSESDVWKGETPYLSLRDMLLPYCNTERSTLLEIIDVVAPLLDDSTLINLRVYEIWQILAKTISLLYKVMEPVSLPLVDLGRFFHTFLKLYYEERESDLVHNRNLKFHKSGVGFRRMKELLVKSETTTRPKDMLLSSKLSSTLMDVMNRLETYELNGRFVKQQMIY